MFKKIEVDNFKSLVHFSMELTPMTVIVGNNATGKSSILQVIDFLCNSVNEDFNVTLERRNWYVDNVRSKIHANNSKIQINSLIELQVDGHQRQYVWELSINAYSSKNLMELHAEKITNADAGNVLLDYAQGKGGFYLGDKTQFPIPDGFVMQSSILKNIAYGVGGSRELLLLKAFLQNSVSFEMLSPADMRLSSRGKTDSIGLSGNALPSFIKSMDVDQKERFLKKLAYLLDGKITGVEAKTKGKPGWTEICVQENYKNRQLSINSKELSDGMLRILAFVAISEMEKKPAVMLLDEIENGINISYAEHLIGILKEICAENERQLVVTTHSTVFLDYVDSSDIVYLYRDDQGITKAVSLFASEEMRSQLEYMWPGEVLLNMSQTDILEKLLSGKREDVC